MSTVHDGWQRAIGARLVACTVSVVIALVSASAQADPINLQDVHVQVGWENPNLGGADWYWVDTLVAPDPATGDFSDGGSMTTAVCDLQWSVSGNADPIVFGAFTATNISAVTQTFVMIVGLPLGAPLLPSTGTSGVMNVTVVDLNSNTSAITAVPGGSIYTSYIDAVPHKTLLDNASFVSAVDDTAGGSQSFGLPGQTFPGPAALGSISIEYRFNLSPGDQATVNGNFIAVAVPEPATGVAAITGLAAMAARRRRIT